MLFQNVLRDFMKLTHNKSGSERGTLQDWTTARVYLWDNNQPLPLYHLRMCRLPSNTRRKLADSLNSREGRDLNKHTPHLCPTTSHMHILKTNTTVPLTVRDMFRNLL